MKLYSATHFVRLWNNVTEETPRLIADDGTLTDVGNLKWSDARDRIEALKDGESTVCAIVIHAHTVEDGWRIRRLPDYAQGRVLFDTQAKEYVRVSNGKCVLAHDSTESFRRDHGDFQKGTLHECIYAPSEAMALRAIPASESVRQEARLLCGWTYRTVNPCHLEPCGAAVSAEWAERFEMALSGKAKDGYIGRV